MGYKYYRDFPRRHLTQQTLAITLSTGCLSPFLGLSGAGLWFYGISTYRISWVFGLGIAFFAMVLFYFVKCFVGSIRDDLTGRIVPYFRERVGLEGVDDAFWNGEAMAKRCRQLDQLAERHDVLPLSSFGYYDDWRRETLTWYNTADGIRTIDSLESHLSEIGNCGIAAECDAILDDLKRMRNALVKAGEKNIPFCLILRNGLDKSVCPMEMDQRSGSFW